MTPCSIRGRAIFWRPWPPAIRWGWPGWSFPPAGSWRPALPPGRLPDQLARIAPAECLLSEESPPLPRELDERMMVTRRPGWAFSLASARQALAKHFRTAGLEGFGFGDTPADDQAIAAAGAVLGLPDRNAEDARLHISTGWCLPQSGTLEIDQSSRRSLEITRTIREGRREGSLLAVLDNTATAMGSRLLDDWLANPLVDAPAIRARHEAVDELVGDAALAAELREVLRRVYDVERLLARATTGRASPRDLAFLGRTLRVLPGLKARLTARRSPLLCQLEGEIDLCVDLRSKLDAALAEECPLAAHDGGFIRDGFHPPLDALRELAHGGKQWIARYQAQESQRTGIPTLKVGFNKVFGYYIEITNTHRQRIPDDYIRKQTVKNAERYITPELKQYEEQVLTADEKSKEMEYELFLELREAVTASRRRLQGTAAVLAQLDVLAALAELARLRNYCRPEIVEEPVLRILDGRHPVLDVVEPEGTFVPNDVLAGGASGNMLLITGPNMAGKSTYIRQTALIVLLAQMGSFVPARSATIGLCDRIFARVGASDELSRGQSTFMVEMTETARILNTATAQSLVILDEIGRGTSTYDGISLAWSVVEYLHDHVGCRTLFATHYHELTDLEKSLSGVKNYNVSVREWQEEVVFLHKIVEGAADKSYGIHVARLAGVPREVIQRSKEILAQLEEEHLDAEGRARIAQPRRGRQPRAASAYALRCRKTPADEGGRRRAEGGRMKPTRRASGVRRGDPVNPSPFRLPPYLSGVVVLPGYPRADAPGSGLLFCLPPSGGAVIELEDAARLAVVAAGDLADRGADHVADHVQIDATDVSRRVEHADERATPLVQNKSPLLLAEVQQPALGARTGPEAAAAVGRVRRR